MNWLTEIVNFTSSLDESPENVRILFVALLGLVGFALTLAVGMLIRAATNPLKTRIEIASNTELASSSGGIGTSFLQKLGLAVAPKAEEKKATMAERLEQAGYRSSQALTVFFGVKLLGLVLVPIILVLGVLISSRWAISDSLGIIVLSGLMAFVLPDVWLSRKIRRRQKHLTHGLPDSIDLMVVCSEAGLGLNSAISRVADEIGVQHPELAGELQLMMMQIRAGMDNRTALKELQRRTGLSDIRAFVATLLQAMRFGTSISESLRVFSEEMRDKRLQKAQEIAARLSITMLMPIALCMMPMFLLIVMGPPLLSLMRASTVIAGG